MLTLSVKTCCGPTSVRIEYSCGLFRLDSISPARSGLLSFPSVPSLLQHYVSTGQRQREGELEEEGKSWESRTPKGGTVPLKLRHPLHRPQSFPSLQHLTRLVINRHASSPAHLPLPRPLILFLLEYPFYIWGNLMPPNRFPPSIALLSPRSGQNRHNKTVEQNAMKFYTFMPLLVHPQQQWNFIYMNISYTLKWWLLTTNSNKTLRTLKVFVWSLIQIYTVCCFGQKQC